MIHFHITSWSLAILFFVITYFLMKSGKEKPAKILHMITRLFYILVLATGLDLVRVYFMSGEWFLPGLKMLLGILLIGTMEMTLIRTKKQKQITMPWVLTFILFIAVLFMGYGVLPG